MKVIICSVRDSAIESFANPFCIATRASAVRSFGDAVNRGGADSTLVAHPEHFALYEVGSFDDQTGEIVGCSPVMIISALDLKARAEADASQMRLVG